MAQSPQQTLAIAKAILGELEIRGGGANLIKLTKLIYLFQGWALAMTGRDPLNEEPQMGFYGPVYPAIYNLFRKYGNDNLSVAIIELETSAGEPQLSQDEFEVLSHVVSIYGQFEGFQLSALTRAEDGPWQQIMDQKGANGTIPAAAMQSYFAGLAAADAAA